MKQGKINKNSMVSGALILGICMVLARFLGIFFRIPLQNLIKDEGMGYYQMSYPIYLTFVAIASGIPIALSKMVSEYSAKGNYQKIRECVQGTIYIMMIFACTVSFLLIVFSEYIVQAFGWHEKSYHAFLATAIAPIFVVLLGTMRGFFQGIRNMAPAGISQIIEQIGRVVLGVGLAYLLFDKGVEYSAAGAVIGAVIGAFIASLYLFYKYRQIIKTLPKVKSKKNNETIKKVLRIAVPISVVTTMGSLMALFDNMIVPKRLLEAGFSKGQITVIFGQTYGKAATLNNVPLALSMAMCASIVPVIAEARLKNRGLFVSKIRMAVKLAIVIAVPAAAGLYFLAYPIMDMVFRGSTGGYEILKLLAISLPFVILTQATTSIFNAVGKYYVPIIHLTIACVSKIIVTYYLVARPELNIKGALIGTIIGYGLSSILNMRYIIKNMKISFDGIELVIKPLLAALIMIITVVFTFTNVYNYTESNNLSCILAILTGIISYGIMALILKIFEYEYIKNRIKTKDRDMSA